MTGPFKCYTQKKINISSECNKHFRHYRHHQFHPPSNLLHFFDSSFSNFCTPGYVSGRHQTARSRALALHFFLYRFFHAKRKFEFVPYRLTSSHDSHYTHEHGRNQAEFSHRTTSATALLTAHDERTKKSLHYTCRGNLVVSEQAKYNRLQMHTLSDLRVLVEASVAGEALREVSDFVHQHVKAFGIFSPGTLKRSYSTLYERAPVEVLTQVRQDAFIPEPVEALHPQATVTPSPVVREETAVEIDTFAATQIRCLREAFAAGDYDRSYSIFQALVRNNHPLESLEDYNMLLTAIARRSPVHTASGIDESVEENLSKVLTVYEALLAQAPTLRPSSETYAIVLTSLLDGARFERAAFARRTLLTHSDAAVPPPRDGSDYHTLACLIFQGIATGDKQCERETVERLLEGARLFGSDPSGLYNALGDSLSTYAHYHTGRIESMSDLPLLLEAYSQFQEAASALLAVMAHKHTIYALMLKQLVAIGEINTATKFLDDIVMERRDQETSSIDEVLESLINLYLQAMVDANKDEKAFALVQKFSNTEFLPAVDADILGWLLLKQTPQANVSETNKLLDWYLSLRSAPPSSLKAQTLCGSGLRNEVLSLLLLSTMENSSPEASALFSKLLKVTLSSEVCLNLTATRTMVSFLLGQAAQDPNAARVLRKFLVHQFGVCRSSISNELAPTNLWFSGVVDLLVPRPHCPLNPARDAVLTSLLEPEGIIATCVQAYKLQKDNIFGIIQLFSGFIFPKYHSAPHTPAEIKLVLALEARLLNEFEDADNHYVELPAELMEFKRNLKLGFEQLWASVGRDPSYGSSEVEACAQEPYEC